MHFIINTHHQDAVQNNMGWWSHLVSAPETYSNPPIGIPASLLKGNFSASALKSWCSCFTMTLFRCWTQETPKHLLLTTTCNYPEPLPFELKVLEKFEIFWRKCSWIKTTCQKVWTCDKWTKNVFSSCWMTKSSTQPVMWSLVTTGGSFFKKRYFPPNFISEFYFCRTFTCLLKLGSLRYSWL